VPFPPIERVIYNKKPLDTVICQVRFPSILKIDTEIPSGFQERVRSEYSNLSETPPVILDFQVGNQQNIPSEELRQLLKTEGKNYEFASEDNKWKVNLTRNFVSLSTKDYVKWEGFRERLVSILSALNDIYKPIGFSRIGLRYIDVIVRSKFNMETVSWNELIQSHLLGVLGLPELKDRVRRSDAIFEIELKDGEGTARVLTRTVQAADSREQCFMIDSDFFTTKKTNIDGVLNTLDFFNVRATRLFRWCITKKLHDAMEPQVIR
jgi:uncharacterized protein (TIGR04255 family)